jgi:pimeloyl-ACP methyl ester carboxylesterase
MEAATDSADHPVAQRRNAWIGPAGMVERFAVRKPFNLWQADVLRDYCSFALAEPGPDGMRSLQCDPSHEAQIYLRHSGDAIHDAISRLETPVTVMRARQPSPADDPFDFSVSPTWPGLADALEHGTDIYLPSLSHFIPMEAPALVADYIRAALVRAGA